MESIKFPLEEAMKIQEALAPLGYMVHGFKDGWGSGNGLITIELHAGGTFPYRKSLESGHPNNLSMDGVPDSVEWKSEATALRMVGTVLEEIEMGTLWKMGGQIGGLSDLPLETGLLPHRMGYAKVLMLFDMDKLKEYLAQETAENKL